MSRINSYTKLALDLVDGYFTNAINGKQYYNNGLTEDVDNRHFKKTPSFKPTSSSSSIVIDAVDASLGSGSFTIEFFIKGNVSQFGNIISNGTTTNSIIISTNPGSLGTGSSTNGVLHVYPFGLNSGSIILDDKWHHIAITRDSSNIVRLFVDGQLKASTTKALNMASSNLSLGHGYQNSFMGSITDFGISVGEAKYISNFITPSSPLIKKTDNKILLLSDDRAYSLETIDEVYETKMTSNTTPSPYVASASSTYTATYAPWRAFNGTLTSNTDAWLAEDKATSAWIQLDFGVGTKVNTLSALPRLTTPKSSPKDFQILASFDGINFTILAEFKNEVDWVDKKEKFFVFHNNLAYRYYRVNILSNNGLSFTGLGGLVFGYKGKNVSQLPQLSKQNFINYAMDSPLQLDGVFAGKNYILQDDVSEKADGLWVQELNRKPLSIKFD